MSVAVVYHIDRLLEQCCRRQAAELRLETGLPPRAYVGNNFQSLGTRPLSAEDGKA